MKKIKGSIALILSIAIIVVGLPPYVTIADEVENVEFEKEKLLISDIERETTDTDLSQTEIDLIEEVADLAIESGEQAGQILNTLPKNDKVFECGIKEVLNTY